MSYHSNIKQIVNIWRESKGNPIFIRIRWTEHVTTALQPKLKCSCMLKPVSLNEIWNFLFIWMFYFSTTNSRLLSFNCDFLNKNHRESYYMLAVKMSWELFFKTSVPFAYFNPSVTILIFLHACSWFHSKNDSLLFSVYH